MIDAFCDRFDLFSQTQAIVISKGEFARFIAQAHDLFGELKTAFAAFRPHLRKRHVHAKLLAA